MRHLGMDCHKEDSLQGLARRRLLGAVDIAT